MKPIRDLLSDRRRSQRGSVLSGVLIMTAMLAIIAGALMTELSTNFVISADLKSKFAYQATMSSAIESSLNRLQATQLNAPCPGLPAVNLNNTWAVPTYASCWPAVDVRSSPFTMLNGPSGAPFNVDAFRSQVSGDYVLGSSGGAVYDYPFGSTSPRWSLHLGGSVTGPPLAMSNPGTTGYLDVIPASGSLCAPAGYCLSVWTDDGSSRQPVHQCEISTSSAGSTQPFASPSSRLAGIAYYSDGAVVKANDLSGFDCDPGTSPSPGAQPVVAGPIAYCSSTCSRSGSDYVFAVVSDGSSSSLLRYSGALTLSSPATLALPWPNAVGMTPSSLTLPATLAITFQDNGGLALVSIATDGTMTLSRTRQLGEIVTSAPYWCTQCGTLLIGVGALDGGLYLLDTQLNPYATYPAGGYSIRHTPAADGAGNWYFGADDGFVHEAQLQGSQLVQVRSYGRMGRPGTSLQVGACSVGICVYLGGLDGNADIVPLDARDAVIKACISTTSTGCSGANPKLSVQVEVGAAGDKQTVHIQGWTYYSG